MLFCRCKSEACTLLELGLWPATPSKPVMAFTFGLMKLVEKMFLVGKVSVQQCCASLPGLSNFPVSVFIYMLIDDLMIHNGRYNQSILGIGPPKQLLISCC